MPCARPEGSPALSIALTSSSKRIFQAGDTITGHVVRRAHMVAPECRITIRLLGRAKTKIVITRGNGNGGTRHETYRSRYHFFGPETSSVLFSGPLHVAEQGDPATFPFAVTIPTCPSANLSREAQGNSFLPTDPASVATQMLPPSYTSNHHHKEGYVEYWLEAQLSPGPGTNNKAVTAAQSTQPILLGAPNTREPAPPRIVKTLASPAHSITSYNLIPGMNEVSLSLKQKSKQFFHTSSVPSLAYAVHVGLPVVMQLQPNEAIPLTLRLSPTAAGTSDDVRKTTQKATINYMTVHLKQYTVIRAGEHFFGGPREESMSDTIDLHFDKALKSLPAPMVVDIDADGEPVNLGALFDLRLSESGFSSGTDKLASHWFGPPITTDFVTYNMTASHALKVAVSVTVCGKEHVDTFKFDTRIMAPPAIAAAVPRNGANNATEIEARPAPPSFAEAMHGADRPPDYKPKPAPSEKVPEKA
ncbi:hypothetical protein CCM_01905 [Cordyceps militaris CM01]|uniref:Arrestin-like N-terminal domain-containing protein n=1 Tax=Cordyceps militaris (strain CM01) TaxID=983644 RepID=G3J2W6_CORMM|nr:uncharacterized protein CCM_01905 [Cordyceps militaris CM01]EGX97245.1 hypothetical protein CCM_01905 [Cordyceps militaris CM01]